jgi:hypothetical protein
MARITVKQTDGPPAPLKKGGKAANFRNSIRVPVLMGSLSRMALPQESYALSSTRSVVVSLARPFKAGTKLAFTVGVASATQ